MHRCWLHVALTLCTAALLAGPAGPVWGDTNRPSGALEIGQAVPALQFKDIRYLWRTLEEFGEPKAYVLAFTTTACPVAQRYLPVLKRLEETYRARGVQFVAVNVGADDSIKDMAYQAIEHDVPFPFVKDATGEAARVLGVGRTPEVVVLDSERRLRYRGRIDRRYRVSGVSPQAGRADLQEAIEDVLAGRDVRLAETPVDGCLITLPDQREPDDVPTFAQDIAPLVQEHCQECHRPGREAPFSLITYDDVRAMGDMIAEVVAERRMPPWYASDKHGEFINRRALSRQERQTIADWVLGGMPAGDMEKMPEPPRYSDQRWLIGEPDLVVTMAETVTLPAEGYIPYKYFVLPYVFPHDTWVKRIQILPDNPPALHHCNMAYVPPGGDWGDAKFVTGVVPGGDPMILDPGVAFPIPKGSMLLLQAHYEPTGREETDRISVGFTYPRTTVRKTLRHLIANDKTFAIPPGATHHEVTDTQTLQVDAVGIGLFCHMHLRGKDMTLRAHYPDGNRETLLVVPNYSFDWQMSYRWAPGQRRFPKGTRIECIAHYDNSAFNPYNPDPSATVKDGPSTYHEMMYGFFFYVDANEELELKVDPATGKALTETAEAK